MFKKLFDKHFTFILVPHNETQVKNKRISYGTLYSIFFIVLVVVALTVYVFVDYRNKIVKQREFDRLFSENILLKEKFDSLKKDSVINKRKIDEMLDAIDNLLIANNLPPTSKVVKELGVGGSESGGYEDSILIMDPRLKKEIEHISTTIITTENRIKLAKKLLYKIMNSKKMNTDMWQKVPTNWPVTGWITSGFGNRLSPITGKPEFHTGLDIAQAIGTPIVAPADGVVVYVGTQVGWGHTIKIRHSLGIITRYAHLDSIKVRLGEKVKKGEIIGTVGNSGYSIGPHLHYEVRIFDTPVDPLEYILVKKN